jgi:hypothetical protein
VAASYYASGAWTLSAFGSANLGDERSERGSFPQRASWILRAHAILVTARAPLQTIAELIDTPSCAIGRGAQLLGLRSKMSVPLFVPRRI